VRNTDTAKLPAQTFEFCKKITQKTSTQVRIKKRRKLY